jgi:hypothetical protein
MIDAPECNLVKHRTMLVTALLVLALGMPAGARASDTGGGCGGTWNGGAPKACTFNFRGFPIYVSADARVASGTARAHIWVTVEGLDGTVIYECTASATGYAQCNEGLVDIGQDLDERWLLYHLRCHVDGVASSAYTNSYYCKSALGF